MATNSGYSGSQILSMQKDAVRRVNEMQRQARERLRQTQAAGPPPPARPAPEPAPPPAASEPAAAGFAAPGPAALGAVENLAGPFQGVLQRLGLDQESVTLLVLLLLLVNEGADSMLILALVYILI